MKDLNKMRLLAGIEIDPVIEVTEKKQVNEARTVPGRKTELTAKDEKSLKKVVASVNAAAKHLDQAVNALDKAPAVDFTGEVPRFINELEDLISDVKSFSTNKETELRRMVRSANAKRRAEEEEELAANIQGVNEDEEVVEESEDLIEDNTDANENVEESVHFYKDDYEDFEEDPSKPVNVSDGSSNAEQVFDEPMDPKNVKDENPTQLHTGDEKSEQDQSDGHDLEADFKVPASIKTSLKDAISVAKAEADKLDVYNKESAVFYRDTQRAFEDLLGHLEKGTRYDFKHAQHYTQSLMGPMLHKLPADVWKFITNGGQTRSLKDYMKKVPDPITGPRNTID